MVVTLLPILILLVVFVLTWRLKAAPAARVTEPSCGGCGYCVRGLETFTCPECGGDLRELGIITPGTIKPMSRRMRLLLWTIAIPLPAFIVGSILADRFAPWETSSTTQRVLFSHVPGASVTVRIQQTGSQVQWGRISRTTIFPPPQDMSLTLESRRGATPLNVKLSDDVPTDTQAIADWLRAHNITADAGGEITDYLTVAVDDMKKSVNAGSFLHFKSADQQPRAVAHPTFRNVNIMRPLRYTPYLPYSFAALIWLLGLPFVLRARRPGAQFSAASGIPSPT